MANHRSRIFTVLTSVFILFSSQFSGSTGHASPPNSPSNPNVPATADQIDSGGILTIPLIHGQVIPDDSCKEYAGAAIQTFMDGNGKSAIVYLMHDDNYLYVCIQAQLGYYQDRFASLYLDLNGDGGNTTYAQPDDFAFHNSLSGVLSSFSGTGVANGYQSNPSLDGFVQTYANTSGGDGFEYRLQINERGLNLGCKLFRIATYHHWFFSPGDDYGWPSNQWYDQPGTWQLARLLLSGCTSGDIAYVYRGNAEDATSFYNLLTSNGYGVDLIPLASVLTTEFLAYKMIIIANDTGSLDQWGSNGLTDAQVAQIRLANKPILGLGEGGYAFFGKLSLYIGWPRGWHGPQNVMNIYPGAPAGFFNPPAPPVTHYSVPYNSVGIYLPPKQSIPADVFPIGLENPPLDHSPLIAQGCRFLWGNSGNPQIFTADGKLLFLNTIAYVHGFQCSSEQPPDLKCRSVTKIAVPAEGTPVSPGDVIAYTLTYTFSNQPACNNSGEAKIVDSIPIDTTYVPNSASDSISPGGDGSLTWSVAPGTGGTKTFKVTVSDAQCNDQRMVNNKASLLAYGYAPVTSNVTSHPVSCPPVGFPTTQPPYAEDELQVQPYPLLAGVSSEVSVRLTNSGLAPASVTVAFQVHPGGIGIGLPYTTFDTRTVTIPAVSRIILKSNYLPAISGLACFQVMVTAQGYSSIKTQSCLDNIEDFSGNPPYPPLNFLVGNPTPNSADIMLVVDNTCPGWSAAITDPVTGVFTNVGSYSSDLRNATLQVTPPSPAILGSGCHIDVQGWIINPTTGAGVMIGGIRKLDIPPVHLPLNYQPPWEEPEISFNPNPPVVGQFTQYCVELQNPLGYSRNVTIDYAIADFGAGIPFTPVQSQDFTLPPNSIDKYCINWWPSIGGTLHRCALVTLHQAGYLDETSQKNIDFVNVPPGGLGQVDVPFSIGNPDLVTHTLTITPMLFGINPIWQPTFFISPGNLPPEFIGPGETLFLHLGFMINPSQAATAITKALVDSGDSQRVEVAILQDDERVGGFTVELAPKTIFIPVVSK